MHILIVDDEEAFTCPIQDLLEDGIPNVSITTARSGHEAIFLLHCQRFDVVLTDLHMLPGETDGIAVIKAACGVGVPFVYLLTGDSSEEIRVAAIQAGATGVLSKAHDLFPEEKFLERFRAIEGGLQKDRA